MKQKWVKCIARVMLPCFVFFVFSFSFAPKAYAADAELAIAVGLRVNLWDPNDPNESTAVNPTSLNYVNTLNTPISNKSVSAQQAQYVGDALIYTNNTTQFYDNVKIYASYYFTGVGSVTPRGDYMNPEKWTVSYQNSFGTTGVVEGGLSDYISISNPSAVGGYTYALEADFQGSELYPITELYVGRTDRSSGFGLTHRNAAVSIYFPSVRVITTVYSAEMEALDKVADEIAAQSDILLTMKGDLVAILQDIYAMTGDMYAAQNLLNTYIAQMLPLLENIDETTTDIYSLLSTQLRLLETAIENAADSIEAAISAQTAAMIAYLESVLNTGNEVPDDTYQQQQDAANILDQMESLEKPNVDTIVPEIGDYSDSGVSGVLSAIFSSNLIVTMMTLSASFAFGAYVLFGKRE